MSEPHKTFIDLSLEGKVSLDKIEDYIDAWHNEPRGESLCQYLGMKEPEYSLWVRDPEALAYIIEARRGNRSLIHLTNDDYQAAREVKNCRVEVAVLAAKRAAQYLIEVSSSQLLSAEERVKESSHSIVTRHDIDAQRIIIATLREHDRMARVLAEEATEVQQHDLPPPFWVVDPIDGTSYFARGLPNYSISIALVDTYGVAAGVVHCPATDEVFTAKRDGGALLNGRRILVSTVNDPQNAILTFGHQFLREMTPYPGRIEMVKAVRSIRAGGSCAQELAYVAAGRIDGVIAVSQSLWDYAAGMLLVSEAGGKISNFAGAVPTLAGVFAKETNIIATNGLVQPWCLARVRRTGARE